MIGNKSWISWREVHSMGFKFILVPWPILHLAARSLITISIYIPNAKPKQLMPEVWEGTYASRHFDFRPLGFGATFLLGFCPCRCTTKSTAKGRDFSPRTRAFLTSSGGVDVDVEMKWWKRCLFPSWNRKLNLFEMCFFSKYTFCLISEGYILHPSEMGDAVMVVASRRLFQKKRERWVGHMLIWQRETKGSIYTPGVIESPILGGIKQCKCMVVLRDFPYCLLFGLVIQWPLHLQTNMGAYLVPHFYVYTSCQFTGKQRLPQLKKRRQHGKTQPQTCLWPQKMANYRLFKASWKWCMTLLERSSLIFQGSMF